MTQRAPFQFWRPPTLLNRALRERAITRGDYAILVWLYSRADDRTWIASLTLDQIKEGIAWEKTLDYLRKRLNGLKERGWLDYKTVPGRKGHVYAIRLRYGGPQSEQALSTEARADAESGLPGVEAGPSTSMESLSTEEGANTLPDPDSPIKGNGAVGAPLDVLEKPKARTLSEGEASERLWNYDQDVGEGTSRDVLANFDGWMANMEQLAAERRHEHETLFGRGFEDRG